jgi:CheY-like chemotaxis protein
MPPFLTTPYAIAGLIGLVGVMVGSMVNLLVAKLNNVWVHSSKREEGQAAIITKQAELTTLTVWKYIAELQSGRIEDKRLAAEDQKRIDELEQHDRDREQELTVAKQNYSLMRVEVDKLRNFMKNVISSASSLGLRVSERGHLTKRTEAVVAILDDEEGVRDNLADLLSEAGFEVYGAESFEQFLTLLQQYPVDVLLLDVYLATTTATVVVEFLANHPIYKRIKVILCSCGSDATTLEVVEQLKPFAFLAKPLNETEVLRVVHSASNSVKLAQALPSP